MRVAVVVSFFFHNTLLQFDWKRALCWRSRSACFGPHLSAIAAFACAQMKQPLGGKVFILFF